MIIYMCLLQGREVKVTDVVFFGLEKVMPLMTEGLLQFPMLASQYFSLVSALVLSVVMQEKKVIGAMIHHFRYGADCCYHLPGT